MTPTLILSGHDPEPHATELCGNRELGPLLDWFGSLDSAKYPAAGSLSDTLKVADTEAAAIQLERAANETQPQGVTKVAVVKFLELLGGGFPDETAEIEIGD
jgi:hypothetical protein